jgi:hypothetical protein
MAYGPKRAPLRLEVPISSGMPAIEIAAILLAAPESKKSGRDGEGWRIARHMV